MQQTEESAELYKAFMSFDKLCRSGNCYQEIIHTLNLQTFFSQESCSEQKNSAKLLFIMLLHEKFLQKAIDQINLQMQDIYRAKRHCVKHIVLQPFLSLLWLLPKYKKVYKEFFNEKILILESLENVQAELLGICLLSKNRLEKIDNLDQAKNALSFVFDPFKGVDVNAQHVANCDFFNSILFIDSFIQEKHKIVADYLNVCETPEYIDRYFYMSTGVLFSSLVGIFVLKNDNNIAYKEKTLRALHGFLQDFLLDPLKGLKRAVWDRPDIKLKRFDLEQIPETVWTCYTPERLLKYPLQTVLYNMNKGIDVAEEIIKGQQINYYLSAIVPVFLGLYLTYKNASYYYNHKSYFKPMRMILRDIDILCNRLQEKDEMSCLDHGKIYALVFQLQKYIACLNVQEKIMISYDLDELLSFDFTIKQKQKVVERMYRTYSFLK